TSGSRPADPGGPRTAAGVPGPCDPPPAGYSGAMDYVSALLPPFVMAALFIAVIRVIVKTQGGANKATEDAAVDAALSRVEGARQPSGKADACPSAGSGPPGPDPPDFRAAYDCHRPTRAGGTALRSRTPFCSRLPVKVPVGHAIVRISHYCSELCLAHWENSKTRS